MVAISDTCPLILFSRIRRLDLLRDLFDEVLIPQAVWDEIMVDGGTRPGAQEILETWWIRRTPLARPITGQLFHGLLGPGEAEVIGLALERDDSDLILILDDDPARNAADSQGLFVTGSAGVALLAKRRGLIDQVTPILSELHVAGLYLSASVAELIIQSAGE